MHPKTFLKKAVFFIFILLFFCFVSDLRSQTVSTIAGGTTGDGRLASSIGINSFDEFVTDSIDNIYAFDNINHTLRKISSADGIIRTVAGGSKVFLLNDTMSAFDVAFAAITSIAIDRNGKIYIADNSIIFKFDPVTNLVTIFAGSPARLPYGGDNGPAKNAGFSSIHALAVDSINNIYLTDRGRIRKITASTGIITTIGGSESLGNTGDNGPAANAVFGSTMEIALDRKANIYVCEAASNVVRKIDATTNIVSKYAGTLYYDGFLGDGTLATSAGLRRVGHSMAFDAADNLYIADQTRIRMVSASTGIISTVSGSGVASSSGDNGPAGAATFKQTSKLYFSKNGDLYIGDLSSNTIRKWNLSNGIINRAAGNGDGGFSSIGGPAIDAQIFVPENIVVDHSNNLYLSGRYANKIYRIDANTKVITLVAGTGDGILNGGNGGLAINATMSGPTGIVFDSHGNFYFCDGYTVIRKVNVTTGIITAFAGNGVDTNYVSGMPALSAGFRFISSLAIDALDNMYVADIFAHRVTKISMSTGIITTVAGTGVQGYTGDGGAAIGARLNQPNALAVDGNANLYIVESQSGRYIRKVDAGTGIITTIAGPGTPGNSGNGGPATAAQLSGNVHLATDIEGNLYLSESSSSTIRKIDISTGIITAVVGSGLFNYNGENLPFTDVNLYVPRGIVFDTSRTNLYIAESGRHAIRVATKLATNSYTAVLKGSVFFDNNSNGIKDAGEPLANDITISATKTGYDLRTISQNGLFRMELDSGAYTIKPMHLVYHTASPNSFTVTFTKQVTSDSISFALQPVPGKKDLSISIMPTTAARAGFKAAYQIDYKNDGSAATNNTKVIFVKNRNVAVKSSVPLYSSMSGDTLTWNLNTINPGTPGIIKIDATITAPPIVNVGDSMYFSAIIMHDAVDLTPANDTARLKQRITGSLDPNDKTETHGGAISPAQIAAGEYLNYVIRFQNTGNDTAFTVEVRDTLDAMLDIASLQMISASHSYQLLITGGNKLSWHFENILLPDSNVNEPASHGFISFRIKPKSTVALGSVIQNKTDIYFDFNLPVTTNSVSTKVKELAAYPAKPVLNVTAPNYCKASGVQQVKLLNPDKSITAIVTLGSVSVTVGIDSIFNISPALMVPGNYTVRVEYVNESGTSSILVPVSVIDAITPELGLSASKTTITTEPDNVIITGTDKKGGGTTPLFTFAKDRSFTNIIQAESSSKTVSINASALANGDNWIYVRLKTSESCYTALTVVDSVKITKALTTTGLTDIDNPSLSITSYPNPFSGGFTVSGLSSIKNYSVRVYDIRGVMIHTDMIKRKNSYNIRASAWSKGVYWVYIFDVTKNRVIGTLKVIKE